MSWTIVLKRCAASNGSVFRRDDARYLFRRCLEILEAEGVRVEMVGFEPNAVRLVIEGRADARRAEISRLFDYFTRRFSARYQRRGRVFRSKWIATPASSIEGAMAVLLDAHRQHNITMGAGEEPWIERRTAALLRRASA